MSIKLYIVISILSIFTFSVSSEINNLTRENKKMTIDKFELTKKSAIHIAEILFKQVYGESITEKKPFVATNEGSFWIIKGTLATSKGGVPLLKINKFDCTILELTHGK